MITTSEAPLLTWHRTRENILAAKSDFLAYLALPTPDGAFRIAVAYDLDTPPEDWTADLFQTSSLFAPDETAAIGRIVLIEGHRDDLEDDNPRDLQPYSPTPWGEALDTLYVAPGILRHHTASHGGYQLDPEMNALVHPTYRNEGGWYEEDVEWAKVAVTFPTLFPMQANIADDMLREYHPYAYEQVNGITLTAGPDIAWHHTGDHTLAAQADRVSYLASLTADGRYRIAVAFDLDTPPAQWTADDFFQSSLFANDEITARDRIALLARQHQELESPPLSRELDPGVPTPWGDAHRSTQYAEGFVRFHTTGTPGYHLDQTLNDLIPPAYRRDDRWYDEHIDWSKIAVTFPTLFPHSQRDAAEILRRHEPRAYEQINGLALAPDQPDIAWHRTRQNILAANASPWSFLALPTQDGAYRIAIASERSPESQHWDTDHFFLTSLFAPDEATARDRIALLTRQPREGSNDLDPGTPTPWGNAQQSTTFAGGIVRHHTATHGGFHLDPAQNALVHPAYRNDSGWYEKGAEWTKVAVTFPTLFPLDCDRADELLAARLPDLYKQVNSAALTHRRPEIAWHRTDEDFLAASASPWSYLALPMTDGGYRIAIAPELATPPQDWTPEHFYRTNLFAPNHTAAQERIELLDRLHRSRTYAEYHATEPGAVLTPWGESRSSIDYGEGIVHHTTGGIFGFHLDADVNELIPPGYRHDDGWYDEHIGWASVASTFPTLYPNRLIAADQALRYLSPGTHEELNGPTPLPRETDITWTRTRDDILAAGAHPWSFLALPTQDGGYRITVAWADGSLPLGWSSKTFVPTSLFAPDEPSARDRIALLAHQGQGSPSELDPGTPTPWGEAQKSFAYADGIVEHHAPGHTGFHVDPDQNALVHPAYRNDNGWYENDGVQSNKLALTFPTLFPFDFDRADQLLATHLPDAYAQVNSASLALTDPDSAVERTEAQELFAMQRLNLPEYAHAKYGYAVEWLDQNQTRAVLINGDERLRAILDYGEIWSYNSNKPRDHGDIVAFEMNRGSKTAEEARLGIRPFLERIERERGRLDRPEDLERERDAGRER